jgi:hypothetical protein
MWYHGLRICFKTLVQQKNDKIADNPATTEARDKIPRDLEFLEFLKFFHVCLTKFKNNPILLNKISHKFLVTTTQMKKYIV